jgi:secreted Zn-dependent insulinase-like peptidase
MVKILPAPEKSSVDKKLYRAIELDNGLVALLISEVDVDALSMNAQSFVSRR